ncbi:MULTISPECIES: threonine/serine exporter family protein [Niastella]|uniref:Threonine/serine exporter family protein n=1 Tax=Niastella soli TaxID=2821487 RepID=A0ABS3Z2A0_9BACT|nr:threonine/serine exporter family protein [Niastella soli]MBO9204284.1 threonine/serine exporter family protein [Niastella soli]
MSELLNMLFKAFWVGCAAFGFAILFNVPRKYLATVWIGGALVGLIKYGVLLYISSSIILATFVAALVVGIYSVVIARIRREPPMILTIPTVIPLVPGAFAYRTMYGLIKLTGNVDADYSRILSETVRNGALTLFIILSFTIGIIIPYEIGKEIAKKIN